MVRWIFLCLALALVPVPKAVLADASYRVTVTFDWQQPDLDDPHWSRLIAVAHAPRYTLFADGQTASSGLALVATNGRVSVLEAELEEGRRRGRVGSHVVLPGIAEGQGQFVFELEVSQAAPMVSFATMLAPSPDWFSGASRVDLRGQDYWLAEVEVALWVWDAGVDGGAAFVAANAETQPRESVRLLVHPAFLKPEGLAPIGRARFSRVP